MRFLRTAQTVMIHTWIEFLSPEERPAVLISEPLTEHKFEPKNAVPTAGVIATAPAKHTVLFGLEEQDDAGKASEQDVYE